MEGITDMRRAIVSLIGVFSLLVLSTTSCKNPNLSGGILHFDQMRYERSRETLLKAIGQEPRNAEAYLWLGKAYAELDSTQESVDALEKAREFGGTGTPWPEIAKDVDNAREHYWSIRHNQGLADAKAAQESKQQAKIAESQKHFREALNQFKRAQIFLDNKEETPRNMGVCYFNLGQVDSGLTALKLSQKLAPEGDDKAQRLLFEQYRQLGDQAAEQGNVGNPEGLQQALKFYREAEKIRPKDSDLLFSLGVVEFQLAEADTTNKTEHQRAAVDYFEKTLEIKPDDQEALQNVASLYWILGECDQGLVRAKTLLDLDPHNYRYYDILGRLYDCTGNKTERIAGLVFSRALRDGTVQSIVPEEFRARLESGAASDLLRIYREEGRPEEIRVFNDSSGRPYECWFYWTRGRAFAFLDGTYKYQTEFKAEQPKEEEE